MDVTSIADWINRFAWYHSIDLGDGCLTPGQPFEPVWDNIRTVRNHIDYTGKSVLDIGSMEGMWAFEAEALGASAVAATDCYCEGGFGNVLEKFLFCRQRLSSSVMPFYNVSPYELWPRLNTWIRGRTIEHAGECHLFDIVQNLGVLYHVRDPLFVLSQTRNVIRTGGELLLETAAVANDDRSALYFNGVPPDPARIYDDRTTWWAPTIPCLKEMARAALFEPLEQTLSTTPPYQRGDLWLCRVAMVCRAVDARSYPQPYADELCATYRNPGLTEARFTRVPDPLPE